MNVIESKPIFCKVCGRSLISVDGYLVENDKCIKVKKGEIICNICCYSCKSKCDVKGVGVMIK